MMNLELRRFLRGSSSTLGALLVNDSVISLTIELPFLDNTPRISCIPTGLFVATRVKSPRFGDTFDVEVPSRSLIRFHAGNTVADSNGCILLVSGIVGASGIGSRSAFRRFLDELDGVRQFRLLVSAPV